MTITLTFGTWMIPFGITAIAFIVAWVATYLLEEDYWGMWGPMSIIFGIGASVFSWITWGLIVIFTK